MLCILYAQQPWFLLFFCSTSDLVVVRVQVVVEEEKIHKYSTLMYRAPEMVDLYLNCEVHVPFRVQLIARVLSFASSAFCRFVRQVAEKVDCWAMGCILFALCFRDHPFDSESTLQDRFICCLMGSTKAVTTNPLLQILNASYTAPEGQERSPKMVSLITRGIRVEGNEWFKGFVL